MSTAGCGDGAAVIFFRRGVPVTGALAENFRILHPLRKADAPVVGQVVDQGINTVGEGSVILVKGKAAVLHLRVKGRHDETEIGVSGGLVVSQPAAGHGIHTPVVQGIKLLLIR